MEISVYIFFLIMIGGFVILPAFLKIFFGENKIVKGVNAVLLILFLISAFALTLGNVDIAQVVTINFEQSGEWFESEIYFFNLMRTHDIIQNLLFMTPLGIFTYKSDRFWVSNLWIAFACGAGLGFVIEALQFILPIARYPQVSDVLFNGLSAIIGFVAIFVVDKIVNAIQRKRGYEEDE